MASTVQGEDQPQPAPSRPFPDGRAALVVAHPGHELRLHGWLESVRPVVFVLTDGSGRTGRSRLASTSRVLRRAGAEPGDLYGRFSDQEVYAALLDGDFSLFHRMVDELAIAFIREAIGYVVGDAAEGYNPGHDVGRLATAAAVARVASVRGRPLPHFVFPLIGRPDGRPEGSRGRPILLGLDDHALARKLAAAQTYPGLEGEIGGALQGLGAEAFRQEWIQPAAPTPLGEDAAEPPFYERYGQERVRAGDYQRVLRFRTHVLPVAEALRRDQQRGPAWAAFASS